MARYIDADEYRKRLNMICGDGYAKQVIDVFIDWFMSIAESTESEDVAPVIHAHWEYRYDTGIYQTEFLCSRCKGLIETYSCTVDEVEYEYCPHCGAKMDEEDDT